MSGTLWSLPRKMWPKLLEVGLKWTWPNAEVGTDGNLRKS